tara:strand:- start:393 stop:758 length:366 start_codon:yes stop_codon:yes gene_type:complete
MPNPSKAPRRRFKGRTRSPMAALKPGKTNIFEARKKYDENEDRNYHSENVLLMAETVGTAADIQKAKGFIEARKKAGYLPPEAYQGQQVLSVKLWPKFFKREHPFTGKFAGPHGRRDPAEK